MTFTESVGSRSDSSSSPRPPQRRDGVRGDGPQPTGTSPAQVIFAVVYVAVFPLGLADAWIPGGHRIPFLLSAYAVLFLAGCFVFRRYLARAARRIAARKCRTALVVLVGGIGVYVATVAGFLLSDSLLRATGIILGVVYVKSGRNLYCSAVLHILINLGSLLPNLLS